MDSFVPVSKESRIHRGFAFVWFSTELEALRGIEEVNGRLFRKKSSSLSKWRDLQHPFSMLIQHPLLSSLCLLLPPQALLLL